MRARQCSDTKDSVALDNECIAGMAYAPPLGLHHRHCTNLSHISVRVWETEEGARAGMRPETLKGKQCADLEVQDLKC